MFIYRKYSDGTWEKGVRVKGRKGKGRKQGGDGSDFTLEMMGFKIHVSLI